MSKVRVNLEYPEPMLREIQHLALENDRSMSWFIQRAWAIAREEMLELTGDHERAAQIHVDRYADSTTFAHSLFFVSDHASEIADIAERLCTSESWIMQQAWCLALEELEIIL